MPKIFVPRIAPSRVFWTIVLVTLLVGATWSVVSILQARPWPTDESYYSDTNAGRAVACFFLSTLFWSFLWTREHLFRLSLEQKKMVYRLIDLVWYPCGIFAAVLALGTTTQQYNQLYAARMARVGNLNAITIMQGFGDLKRACRYYRSNRLKILTTFEVRYQSKSNDLSEMVPFPPSVDDICAYANRLPERVSVRKLDGFISDRRVLAACVELHPTDFRRMKARARISWLTDFHQHRIYANRHLYGMFAAVGAKTSSEITPLVQNCAPVLLVDSLQRIAAQFDAVEAKRDISVKNPWVWILILCVMAGLKLSKVAIDLQLARLSPK